MRRLHSLAVASVMLCTVSAQTPGANYCDSEYECEFQSPMGYLYDIKSLCSDWPYSWPANAQPTDTVYSFQICGTSNKLCAPEGYRVEFNYASAMQFFGDLPLAGVNCTDNFLNPVPCTRDCEVLGAGPPIISLLDSTNEAAGVKIAYYSIPNGNDGLGFSCPISNITGAPIERTFTINLQCDATATPYAIDTISEVSPCTYVVSMRAAKGCPCQPSCSSKNCGFNGCGGYCGPAGYNGLCPSGESCKGGKCCQPACHNRNCGDDGCMGFCGSCETGQVCTKYGVCAFAGGSSPTAPVLETKVFITTPADIFAAYVGGIFTTGIVALVTMYVLRWRALK